MNPLTANEEEQGGGSREGRGKDEEGSTSTHYCDTIVIDDDIYVINDNATIAEAVVVRFHPLMLQIVAIPGVVATVWDKKPPLNYTASSCHSRQRT